MHMPPAIIHQFYQLQKLTFYAVDVVGLLRIQLECVEERPRQGRLTVVEVGQLHHLQVGIITPTENRRVVRGGLTVIDRGNKTEAGLRRRKS